MHECRAQKLSSFASSSLSSTLYLIFGVIDVKYDFWNMMNRHSSHMNLQKKKYWRLTLRYISSLTNININKMNICTYKKYCHLSHSSYVLTITVWNRRNGFFVHLGLPQFKQAFPFFEAFMSNSCMYCLEKSRFWINFYTRRIK